MKGPIVDMEDMLEQSENKKIKQHGTAIIKNRHKLTRRPKKTLRR